jgi:hypothetical protein
MKYLSLFIASFILHLTSCSAGNGKEESLPANNNPEIIENAKAEPLPVNQDSEMQTQTDKVSNPYWGVSFTGPQGWKMTKDETRYMFTSDDEDELLVVFQHNLRGVQAIIDDYEVTKNGNAYYTPVGNYETIGTAGVGYGITGTFNEVPVDGYLAVGSNPTGGKGFSAMMVVSGNKYDAGRHSRIAINALKSVHYFTPEKSAAIPEWKYRLTNVRLIYMSSYSSGSSGGMNSRTNIDLCRSGEFTYSDQSSVSIYTDGASGGSNSKGGGSGSWQIVSEGDGAALQLDFTDGRQWVYPLSYKNNKVYLNGTYYMRAYVGDEYGNGPNCQ